MKLLSENEVINLLDISVRRLKILEKKDLLNPVQIDNGIKKYAIEDLSNFEIANEVFNSKWDEFIKIKPKRDYTTIELFAGGGGLALGMEKAKLKHVLLNEFEKNACKTLRYNRPQWNVLEGDIRNIDFTEYCNKIDVVSGGFPCQSFSHAGKGLGFEDTRGTLFFEFARCIKEVKPKVFLGENVKGLLTHDHGKTIETIKQAIKDIGYTLVSDPYILKAMYYKVPQKRERLILIGIRNDLLKHDFKYIFPEKYKRVLTLTDAFKKGVLYNCDVPISEGDKYPKRKKEILENIPQGGYWKDLSDTLQKEYMGKSYFLGGGKTGMARRLAMDTPSLTLVCAPSMKQTERCHPLETRPLTIRESARIQTFPDDWAFQGAKSQQYKQIGNAVPVNLAYCLGLSIVDLLNQIESNS